MALSSRQGDSPDEGLYDVRRLSEHVARDNDDGYIHFDPEIHNLQPPTIAVTVEPETRTVPKSKRRKSKIISDVESSEPPVLKRRNSRAKGKQKDPADSEDDFSEEWEKRVKEKIMQDSNLYLRILRYEVSKGAPIHRWPSKSPYYP